MRTAYHPRHERTYDGQQRRHVTAESGRVPTAIIDIVAGVAIARLPSSLSTVPILVRSPGSTARCRTGALGVALALIGRSGRAKTFAEERSAPDRLDLCGGHAA